ncbi:hypothetical protein LCGC14_0323050 [marine sediment metagenome]|uniref:Uncharacterized protein n=1 Tax=marine sediment metagenome TaxID=412755 RepID=A0A0F9W5X8_9ZZZZ
MELVKSETVDLTPRLAQEFASMAPSPTERESSAKRKKFLEKEHMSGRFKAVHWVKAQLNGTIYRMNGQHSAGMLVDLDGTFPQGAKAHIDTYSVETPSELALLFRTFDSRNSARSALDVSGAYQGLSEVADVDRRLAKMALTGIAWFSKTIDKQALPSGDDLFDLFSNADYKEFIVFYGQVCSPRTKTQELQTAPVVAAMYGTFLRNEEQARVFWPAVALNNAADDSDPAQLLSTQLVEVRESLDVRWGPKTYYAKCIKAWNAFLGGKQINSLKVNTKKELIGILA